MKVGKSVAPKRPTTKLPAWVSSVRRKLAPGMVDLHYRRGIAPDHVEVTADNLTRAMWLFVLAVEKSKGHF